MILFLFVSFLAAQSSLGLGQQASGDSDTLRLFHYVSALQHDSLKGRLPGTPEMEKASRWIENRFREAGLKPLNENYSRPAFLKRATIFSDSYFVLGSDTIWVGRNMRVIAPAAKPIETKLNNMVHWSWSDKIDVRGKHILYDLRQNDAYSSATGYERTTPLANMFYSNGAASVIFYSITDETPPFNKVRTKKKWSGSLFYEKVYDPFWSIGVDVSAQQAESMRRMDLPMVVRLHTKPLMDRNIVGLIEGSDPVLKDELVLVTAHYDHLGVKKTTDRDSIFNGVLDNASGTAGLIYIAEKIAKNRPPKRSILFMATTAEEMNFLGMQAFFEMENSTVGKIVANINIDIMGFVHKATLVPHVTLLGGDLSTLGETFSMAAKEQRVSIMPNYFPSYYYRSDNSIAVQYNIPSLALGVGFPPNEAKAALDVFKKYYHSPHDELGKVPLSFRHMKAQADVAISGIYSVAETVERPRWKKKIPTKSQLSNNDGWGMIRIWIHQWF